MRLGQEAVVRCVHFGCPLSGQFCLRVVERWGSDHCGKGQSRDESGGGRSNPGLSVVPGDFAPGSALPPSPRALDLSDRTRILRRKPPCYFVPDYNLEGPPDIVRDGAFCAGNDHLARTTAPISRQLEREGWRCTRSPATPRS